MNESEVMVVDSSESLIPNFSCQERESPETELYRFITNGIMLNIIGFLGIIGNIISMIILSRPQMRSSINYILTGLARMDTILIITSILLFGVPGIYPYTGYMRTYYFNVYPHIVPVVYPLAMTAQTASVYLTVMVSLDRFVAVCHPLRSRSICTYGRARLYVIGIIVFSVVYSLPKLFEASVKDEWDPVANMTIFCAYPSKFRLNPLYVTIYVYWCYLIFLYLIPFISLAVLNAAIYRQIRKADKERQRLSRLQRREIGLAVMLMCVVMVFFLCNMLPLVINIIESFSLEFIGADMLDRMIKTSNLLVTINSSVNFIIYVIFGEKFKRLFLMLFCSHGFFGVAGRDSPDGATHDESFMSNGDRTSIRLHRQNTAASRNGFNIRTNGTSVRDKRSNRIRVPSPGPCVYYPGTRGKDGVVVTSVAATTTFNTQTSVPNAEWKEQNGSSSTNSTGF